MHININNLAEGFSESVFCEGIVVLPNDIAQNNSAFVKLKGTITNTDKGKYSFDGKAHAVLTLNCVSCLKSFEYNLDFDINEVYTDSENPREEEMPISGGIVDLEAAVRVGILLNLPMRAVCSENCKGLCHVCGHNLNEGDCGCERNYIDPRFEILRSFLDDKEV